MRIDNIQQANQVLAGFIPNKAERTYRLDRMRELMDLIGNPQERLKIIHVAGTAGKTSTCYFIATMLQSCGKTVGLSVSPHVSSPRERLQVLGKDITEKQYCALLEKFATIPGVIDLKTTYFEFLVAFAFWGFDQLTVDYTIMEVGLGGLLDGTNVVKRQDKVCVITDIGLAHTAVLGKTLEAIAAQKASIIQPGNVAFMLKQPKKVVDTIRAVADRQDASLLVKVERDDGPKELPLYQQRNWSLARQVSDYIADRDNLKPAANKIQDWQVPGRMEQIDNFILDGAHNPVKFEALVKTLRQRFGHEKIPFILGMIRMPEKMAEQIIRQVSAQASSLLVVPVTDTQDLPYRTMNPDDLVKIARKVGIEDSQVASDLEQAISQSRDNEITVVTGSLFLLGEAKALLLKDEEI